MPHSVGPTGTALRFPLGSQATWPCKQRLGLFSRQFIIIKDFYLSDAKGGVGGRGRGRGAGLGVDLKRDAINDVQGVDDVAQGLGHLAAVGVPHH